VKLAPQIAVNLLFSIAKVFIADFFKSISSQLKKSFKMPFQALCSSNSFALNTKTNKEKGSVFGYCWVKYFSSFMDVLKS